MPVDRAKIPYLPERIEGLGAVATNLSWSWSRDARQLFAMIDEPLWHLTRHNPIATLRRIPPERLSQVAREPRFLDLYDRVMADYRRDQSFDNTWFSNAYPAFSSGTIAYFCAEFGLHNSVPIYSGGLGILAGDHLKTASDLGLPLVGVGLFYTKGYFDQQLRLDGWQEDSDVRFDVDTIPLERMLGPGGEPYLTVVRTFGRPVHLGAWRMQVGRVPVYLLDTNLELNDPADRELSAKLYAGGPDMRLRQEWLLGVGGVRVLRAAGVDPAAWHANEGHAAFMLVERLRELVAAGHSFEAAWAEVRARSIFTTHTPVPAGHDRFGVDQVLACAANVWEELGISPERFVAIGSHPEDAHPLFHMTATAIRLSARVNGVASEARRGVARDLEPAVARGAAGGGADRRGDQRGAPPHLDVGAPAAAARPAPGRGVAGAAGRAGLLGVGADHRRPGAVEPPHRHEAQPVHLHPGGCPAAVDGAVEGSGAHGGRGDAAQSPGALTIGFARRFATYKRAALHVLGLRPAAGAAGDTRRGRCRWCSPARRTPRTQPGKEVLQHRVRLHARPPARGAGGVHRGLRDAPGPPAGAGRRPVAQPAAGAARGLRHQRHEGGAQRGAPALHPRRLVGGGLRRDQRVGHSPRCSRGRSNA
jgi:starch phosphorylase